MSQHNPTGQAGGQPQGAKKMAYNVLKCRIHEAKVGPNINHHYQIRISDGHCEYRIAVNAKSTAGKPDLYFLVDHNFRHPSTTLLEG